MVAASSGDPNQSDGQSNRDKPTSMGKKRPVRRDAEKRRQQNIQAQKKYPSVADIGNASLAASPGAGSGKAPSARRDLSNNTSTACQRSRDCLTQSSNDDSSVEFSDFTCLTSISPASSSDLALWDTTSSIDPSHLIPSKDTTANSPYWVGYVDCGCLRPHVQFSASQPREYRDLRVMDLDTSVIFPAEINKNAPRVERVCIVQAILSNCSHIGITVDMICDDDAASPFFRPSSVTADDSGYNNTVDTIQSIFKILKQDVRPIREQITTMHHPFIDVLPFPTLRKNLILSRGIVDDDELYHDLLTGLICWGGTDVSRRDRYCSSGYVSTGISSDSRSWEARSWFLQKYWALLGGEDGELVRQSEWWRNMRGDENNIWSGL
ncbi:hypothetical protein MBLNU459_g0258t1 [Dothideomycetes sp. NU459]